VLLLPNVVPVDGLGGGALLTVYGFGMLEAQEVQEFGQSFEFVLLLDRVSNFF
jgi:hypothetical protein